MGKRKSKEVAVQIGDLIQWESNGALQFPEPIKVEWISEDGEWLRVEGSDTGIPASEVVRHTPEKAPAKPKRVAMRNTKASNGAIGAVANPLETDIDAWLARGWVRD